MEQSIEFLGRLEEGIHVKSEQLEKELIPKLKENLQGFQSGFRSVYNFLLEKGLLQEDPYHYEHKFTDLKTPSSDPVSESDKLPQLSSRLSEYTALLDYLNNFYFISVNSMTVKQIKDMMNLLGYIKWDNFSSSSNHTMTKLLAQIIDKVAGLNDGISGKVMASSIHLLQDRMKSSQNNLRELMEFSREKYKYDIRALLLKDMNISQSQILKDRNEILQSIKIELKATKLNLGYYKDLIAEILDEECDPQKNERLDAIIKKLHVEQKIRKHTKKVDQKAESKEMVMNIIREMSRAGDVLGSGIEKCKFNSQLIEGRSRGFLEKMSLAFRQILTGKKNKIEYHLRIKDSLTGGSSRMVLDFISFVSNSSKKAGMYRALGFRESPAYIRAQQSKPDQLIDFIEKNIADLKQYYQKLMALDQFFTDYELEELKKSRKGMKTELTSLKGLIGKISSQLNEYLVMKEELDQLEKLGIDINAQ